MAPPPRCYLHRETRLGLEPTSPSSTIRWNLPTTRSLSVLGPRIGQRKIVDTAEEDIDQDERGFVNAHIASDASIFFRQKARYPRCISWRLVEGRRRLELRAVDLTQERGSKLDARLTLQLDFPSPIRPYGIAFAEPPDHDAVNVFAFTTENELYTLSTARDFFIRPNASETSVTEWCKIYASPAFNLRQIFRIVAVSSLELLCSLYDGGILRLIRQPTDGGTNWTNFFYASGEGGWGSSIRGLIPWTEQSSAQFDGRDLDAAASVATVVSPDAKHLFTVGLNYILRARNHENGKIGAQVDLLGQTVIDGRPKARQLMEPRERCVLQVVEAEAYRNGDVYYLVTYSPKDHQFKFWGVRDADATAYGIYDIHPDLQLIPPIDDILDADAWTLEDFFLKPTPALINTELWIRARTVTASYVFCLRFSVFDDEEVIKMTWRSNWTATDPGTISTSIIKSHRHLPKTNADAGSLAQQEESSTEQTLDLLFSPGRFSTATLEAALRQFQNGLGLPSSKSKYQSALANVSLKQRICDTIGARCSLVTSPDNMIQYGRWQTLINEQWSIYAALVVELHRQREEALSLTYDIEGGLPWLALADNVSPIRKCSEIELLRLNEDISPRDLDSWQYGSIGRELEHDRSVLVGQLLQEASTFRRGFSRNLNDTFTRLAIAEALQNPFSSAYDRMQELYNACELNTEVTQDGFDRLTNLTDNTRGSLDINDDLFRLAFEWLDAQIDGFEHNYDITRYGERMLIRGAQETLELGVNVLFDLLALVIVLSIDLEEKTRSEFFNPVEIFMEILGQLKVYGLLQYLATNTRIESTRRSKTSDVDALDPTSDPSQKDSHRPPVTLLWSIFIGDWKDMPSPEAPISTLLTYWIRAWTFGASLHTQYDAVSAGIMGNLLRHKDFDLASNFLRYLPRTPWATYLKARLHLEQDKLVEAARLFKQAGYGMSLRSKNDRLAEAPVKDVEVWDSSHYLHAHEYRFFNEGLSQYYQHVASLFERCRPQAWTFMAEFSEMALLQLESQRAVRKAMGVDDLDIIDQKKRSSKTPRSVRRFGSGDRFTARSPLGLGSVNSDDGKVKKEDDDTMDDISMQMELSIAEIQILKDNEYKSEILSRLFTALVKTHRWEEAYSCLCQHEDPALYAHILLSPSHPLLPANDHSRKSCLTTLVRTLLSPTVLATNPSAPSILTHLPLSAAPSGNLFPYVDAILLDLARNPPSSTSTSFSAYLDSSASDSETTTLSLHRPYRTLYAFRIQHSDFRGAASALWEWLLSLKSNSRTRGVHLEREREIGNVYLLLINVLASVDPEQAWLLVDEGKSGVAAAVQSRKKKERRIVTLEELRREYQAHLDGVAAVEEERFAFVDVGGRRNFMHFQLERKLYDQVDEKYNGKYGLPTSVGIATAIAVLATDILLEVRRHILAPDLLHDDAILCRRMTSQMISICSNYEIYPGVFILGLS
ncbi:MAG: hypothetical protein M1820_000735 [Bogoriella megaspora]|nr:MAG: hypothetical protein M1820_000735 [Bogoriella megaspora]